MPDLAITVEQAEAVPFAASPTLAFRLKVVNSDRQEAIHTVVLRAQIRIEVARRSYTAEEQEGLRDLFGTPERWGQTLRKLLWTNASTVVPQFRGETTVDFQVPCTFDFTVATTKYFAWFGGRRDTGAADVQRDGFLRRRKEAHSWARRFSWDKGGEISRAGLKVWKDMMDAYYPNTRVAVPAPRRVRQRCINTRLRMGGFRGWKRCSRALLEADQVVRR